jgi:hypothetical protein
VKTKHAGWKREFPIYETIEGHSGRDRSFAIRCHEGPLGYTVRASEEGTNEPGYEFAAFSETSPYSALGRLRDKMHRGVATRYLSAKRQGPRMLHETLRGRISSDGQGGVVMVVDGIGLRIEDLETMLMSREGWEAADTGQHRVASQRHAAVDREVRLLCLHVATVRRPTESHIPRRLERGVPRSGDLPQQKSTETDRAAN